MRILFVSNWFPPIQSGSSYYTSSLAQALAARGHDIKVVTFDWRQGHEPPTGLPFTVCRLPIIKLPQSALFYNLKLMGLAFTPGNIRRLKGIISEFRPQVLHHVNHIFDSTFLSTTVARSANVPIVGSITTPIQHQNSLRQRVMTFVDRLTVGRFGVKRWDAVVSLDSTVHRYIGDLYGRQTQERSVIIPFGVRKEMSEQYSNTGCERQGRPQIVFVGHIHPFRNPVQLINAMPLILEQVPDARLILAGRVDLNEPVKAARRLELTPAHVRFLGETRHSEVVNLMKTSHVFANWVTGPYPSLGTAPMEAMLCSTPVINDLPENLFGDKGLRNGHNIMLVNSREPRAIADAIVRLLRDEGLRQKIALAGKRFVLEHLNWDNIAIQMERLYGRVLEGKGAALGLQRNK